MKMPALSLALTCALSIGAFAQKPAEKADSKKDVPAAKGPVIKNVTPDEAEKLMKEKKDLVILDVRTEEEFADGHLAHAMNMSVLDRDFAAKAATLEGQPILVHCAAGGRSKRALSLLKDKKFSEIYHLESGYVGWIDAGKPVEKSGKAGEKSSKDSEAAK